MDQNDYFQKSVTFVDRMDRMDGWMDRMDGCYIGTIKSGFGFNYLRLRSERVNPVLSPTFGE